MSLLKQLCDKKSHLKSTDTIVTGVDGRRFVENKGNKVELMQKSYGFVVDTKPDNIPAKITDNIYLGSQDCCELDVLRQSDISCVLSIGIEAPCTYPQVNYKFVKCLDLPETDLVNILENDCIPYLQKAVQNNQKVLVHCNAGVSRSASVVIGYLMLLNGFSYDHAYEFAKLKRSCIKPNVGFEKQLKTLKKINSSAFKTFQ